MTRMTKDDYSLGMTGMTRMTTISRDDWVYKG